MKILLTGANGQIGWELARSLSVLGEVRAYDRAQADLSDLPGLRALADAVRPDVIVNAAAYTAVDKAEEDEVLAMRINGEAVRELAHAARAHRALLIHYSTDYVFDGCAGRPWRESDTPNPINAYGRSKLAGEQAIAASGCDFLIFRTTWVVAARGKNFLRTMLCLGAERNELKVVADQFGAPTSARMLADMTTHCVRQAQDQRQRSTFESGLFHLCASGRTTWHGFAEAIFAYTRQRGTLPLKIERTLPVPTSEYPSPALRPSNSSMDCGKFDACFGLHRPTWDESMRLVLEEIFEAETHQRILTSQYDANR